MGIVEKCQDCGAIWQDNHTCETDFHQLLFWEAEFPELGIVHHLMVLCYHLQHPQLYSPNGLHFSINWLREFVEEGASTTEIRRRNRDMVDSGNRTWKIKGRPDSQGSYTSPMAWRMHVADVVDGGAAHYVENVQQWARSVLESLRS